MEKRLNEKQRALNIIWNASKNYSLEPELIVYNREGRADLYWNYIIGAVYRYFDYNMLSDFFLKFRYDSDYIFYQKVMMLGMEGFVFNKDSKDRVALEELRHDCIKKAVENQDGAELFDEIAAAYFGSITGSDMKIRDSVSNLIDDLNFDEILNTEQLIRQMDLIISKYFKPEYDDEFYIKKVRKNKFGFIKQSMSKPSGDEDLFVFADNKGNTYQKSKIIAKWFEFKEKSEKREREFIKNYFGASVVGESGTKAYESMLCSDNHEKCHLHFTRGQFENNEVSRLRQSLTSAQREKNEAHYSKNYIKNTNNIIKLTHRIKNAIENYSYSLKSKEGKLYTEKVWRTVVDDKKIFIRIERDEIPDISVDIMLDASASQLQRQEVIAEEAYIIAESLTNCKIPVKIYSFCSMRNYTVMNLFRDYNETNINDKIFSYSAAGFNRDGMALRTALHIMDNTSYGRKILIVLSDGKPNDMLGIASEGPFSPGHEYSDESGVNDAAAEVRKGWQKGISVLCVFTGRDEEINSIKRIYGQKFTRIMSPDKFAEMVGVLIEKELINK
ncbi:hypothetical protein HZF24_13080 [Sedimentibacter hydroxybenzoicus DSM 7310]|uniref:VWFA domain-containing protein n=1 Tax=Sedimentibacter hydroxybenzoicus DSM 7310 TaxID=1123245 RepID=A0A974BKN5_SEDHY|nr:hypothetical protein [Sedimentibacter hydroxybenzoicus]NYB75075.1 hypothetical protein [Sedimentibacter hydroxybenzoicus DSM 7310]